MGENLFNTLSFDYWHSSLRKEAVEKEEKEELKRQLKKIATLLDSERELSLRLNGITDVDIERLIHYLKFDKEDDIEEGDIEEDDTSYIELNEIPLNEILRILNINKKTYEKNDTKNLVLKKLWNFNRRLQKIEESKNMKPITSNEVEKSTMNLDNLPTKYKFQHNNKFFDSNKTKKNFKNNKEIKPNAKTDSDEKHIKKTFNFNRKFIL
uniref:Uncharacterized protein n=1 Tax=Strongyloides stercoralis TaxID=6248 RepID=A0A0K0EFI0_STRER